MYRNIGRSLFGFKPRQVINEIETMDNEYKSKVEALQSEIDQARIDLARSEESLQQLQGQLNDYIVREHLVAEVMVTAQQSAQKIEEQARERARVMLENSEAELKRRLQELDFLRIKVSRFKEEFRDTLDNYRVSLENVKEEPEEVIFTPTLITNDKVSEPVQKQDLSS